MNNENQSTITTNHHFFTTGNYLMGTQKAPMTGRMGKNTSAPFDRFKVPYEEITFPPLADGTKIAPATRYWDYCQVN